MFSSSDTGLYTCVAKNVLGRTHAAAYLAVNSAPFKHRLILILKIKWLHQILLWSIPSFFFTSLWDQMLRHILGANESKIQFLREPHFVGKAVYFKILECLKSPKAATKELSLCHKLLFSNPYNFATKCFRPSIFQTIWILLDQIIKVWNIKGLHHQVAKIKEVENSSLWQILNPFSILLDKNA